jgi:hypothetical protein
MPTGSRSGKISFVTRGLGEQPVAHLRHALGVCLLHAPLAPQTGHLQIKQPYLLVRQGIALVCNQLGAPA